MKEICVHVTVFDHDTPVSKVKLKKYTLLIYIYFFPAVSSPDNQIESINFPYATFNYSFHLI